MYNLKAKVFTALSTLWLFFGPCHADSNLDLGSQCSLPDNSTVDSVYQTTLFNLQNSLAANAPFYTTTVRKGANKLYGLTPCRGDISSRLCSQPASRMLHKENVDMDDIAESIVQKSGQNKENVDP